MTLEPPEQPAPENGAADEARPAPAASPGLSVAADTKRALPLWLRMLNARMAIAILSRIGGELERGG